MNFELIVAFNKNNVIGINNTILWYVPEDFNQYFTYCSRFHI